MRTHWFYQFYFLCERPISNFCVQRFCKQQLGIGIRRNRLFSVLQYFRTIFFCHGREDEKVEFGTRASNVEVSVIVRKFRFIDIDQYDGIRLESLESSAGEEWNFLSLEDIGIVIVF